MPRETPEKTIPATTVPVRRIILEMRPTDEPGGEVLDHVLVVYADDERVRMDADENLHVPCMNSPQLKVAAAAFCQLADGQETVREKAARLERERLDVGEQAAEAAPAEDDPAE